MHAYNNRFVATTRISSVDVCKRYTDKAVCIIIYKAIINLHTYETIIY